MSNVFYNCSTATTTSGTTGWDYSGGTASQNFVTGNVVFQTYEVQPVPAPPPLTDIKVDHAVARKAILEAANHIYKNPDSYDFRDGSLDYSTACALGWISAFTPEEHRIPTAKSYIACTAILGIPYDFVSFYDRMDELVGRDWRYGKGNAALCVKGLLLYADKYHPVPKTDAQLVSELVAKVEAEPFVESAETPDKVVDHA